MSHVGYRVCRRQDRGASRVERVENPPKRWCPITARGDQVLDRATRRGERSMLHAAGPAHVRLYKGLQHVVRLAGDDDALRFLRELGEKIRRSLAILGQEIIGVHDDYRAYRVELERRPAHQRQCV